MTASPTTTTDLIRRVANAMSTGNVTMLHHCEDTVQEWLIAEDEREALLLLIEAAYQSIEVPA